MSAIKRNKSVTNRPNEAKVVTDLSELLAISDKSEREKSFNVLVNHLLLNKCFADKCHDLVQLLSQLATDLVRWQTCDKLIDKLLQELNVWTIDDKEVYAKYFHVISEAINLKPFKCPQLLETIVLQKFNGLSKFKDETQIQPQELTMFDEMHSLLSHIKIAKFEHTFLRCIDRKFPFLSHISCVHSFQCFVYNVFKVYDYITAKYKHKLLSLIFEKIIEMDIAVTSDKNKITEDVFIIDDCNTAMKSIQTTVLDNTLQILFDFIENKVTNNTKDENEELFDIIKLLFPQDILQMVSCNHLQYVWLYLCYLSNQFFDQFIDYLWDLGHNNEVSLDIREKCLYFMSSLLKNANFVAIDTVMTFMNMCTVWLHKYIEQNDRSVDQLTTEDTIFYIICQILFDTFCSIHSDLDNLSLRRVKAMNFQRIIKCKLNPLAVCHREIESNFLSLARHYQIGYTAQNVDSSDDRLKYPEDVLHSGSYVCPKSMTRLQDYCKHSINSCDNSVKDTNDRLNRFNTSDDSDHMFGSYKMSYSPSKTLWQNLLSDSSPNDHQMDCD
ncbi:RNA polymerase I-specific transcription initiation factor RRN3-like [Oppia nitens]|uniref:RNA polymerase I-specific transcription initiation factor RRN3-like n=1 Tax=Oppia nitens TaxID=1686743 RepID=UPI0023DACAAC|nr:RNA polymerase I-specific transcription initiation factor RRN3-like [Oppia nitens]